MNTGRQILGAALALAAGIVLAGGQNWASAQDTDDGRHEERQTDSQQQERDADQNRSNAESSESDAQSRDSQQSNRQWNDDQQRSDRQRSDRGATDRERWGSERQSNRERNSQRGDRDWDRQSDIRFDRSDRGLTIVNIGAGTPFYRSGLRERDVIVAIDGRQVRTQDDFYRWSDRGERVPVVVLRDGQRETIYLEHQGYQQGRESYGRTDSSSSQAFLGVRFEMRFRNGAVISAVVPGSPAEEAELRAGDEIVAINGRQVDSPREVTQIVESMQPGERIDIEFTRPEQQQTQAVLGEHPRAMASARYDRGQTREGWDQGQYDRGVEQSSYDDEGSYGAPDEYGQSDRGTRSERRGGLLRGLRN